MMKFKKKSISSCLFFIILKEPLLVHKQTTPQKKGLFGAGKSEGVALSGGHHAYLTKKHFC